MNKKYHIIFIIIIVLYYLPYFILGEDFPLDVFDNMNSNIVWNKIAIEHWELIFSPHSNVPNVLGGEVPFSSIFSHIDLSLIPFVLFGSYWGVVINHIIITILGYYGVTKFLKHVIQVDNPPLIWLIAVSFSLIPFWGFSPHVMGLPMLFYCFFRIFSKTDLSKHWVYLLIFSFYSNLILVGLFSLLILSYILIIDYNKTRSIHWRFLKSICFLSTGYLISHYPLIYSFLFAKDYISHRTEMVLFTWNFSDTMTYLWNIIYKGEFVYHGPKYYLHSLYILPVIVGLITTKFKRRTKSIIHHLCLYYFVSHLILFISSWEVSFHVLNSIFQKMPIALDRFLWFIPIFWIIMIALIGDNLIKANRKWRLPFYLLITIQTIIIISNHKYLLNQDKPSFKQYYSEELFNDVKELIGKDQSSYRIMNIGMEPAISQYNGFYTLDGFSANYSLAYKHNFMKIIKKELHKENAWSIRRKFEFWGSMCYFYTLDIGRHLNKENWKPINNLDYDWNFAKDMGAEYVFSPCSINLNNITELELIKSFTDSNYYYPLNVYKIK